MAIQTQENNADLSRVQKTACKIMWKGKYDNYEKSVEVLDLEKLCDRREKLCNNLARKSIKNVILGF